MDASGCLEENEKGVEKKRRRKKKKETIESNVDKAVRRRGCARLYLCHTFLTPGTFPLEESFSPPAGIRPCWMNFSKCFRICNGTTIEQIFLSVSLSSSSSIYSSWEGTSFHASPWECGNTEHAEISSGERSFLAIFFQSRTFYKSVMTPWNICSSLVRPYLYVRSRIKNRLWPSSFTILVETGGEHCNFLHDFFSCSSNRHLSTR